MFIGMEQGSTLKVKFHHPGISTHAHSTRTLVLFKLKLFRISATEILLKCMKAANVGKLVFVSDAMASIGWNDNSMMAMEIRSLSAPSSGHWMLGPYGETKFRAEEIVRSANGESMENGKKIPHIS